MKRYNKVAWRELILDCAAMVLILALANWLIGVLS